MTNNQISSQEKFTPAIIPFPNFSTVPSVMAFEFPREFGFLSLVVRYASQKDQAVLSYIQTFQSLVKERVAEMGIEILRTPWDGEGLYLYPPESLHCVLIYEEHHPRLSFARVAEMDLSHHEWLTADLSQLRRFTIVPRWFFTFGNTLNESVATVAFSLQIYVEREVLARVNRSFKGTAKVYETPSKGIVRGATNIARFISSKPCPSAIKGAPEICCLFSDLNSMFEKPREFTVDCLSFVRSDCWLANSNPIVRDYFLDS
jgi:hypothetical protein